VCVQVEEEEEKLQAMAAEVDTELAFHKEKV
jgi:hypothetical protein